MSEQVCKCGRPTRDKTFTCETCSDSLARALGEVPWVDEEMAVTITRQKGVDYRRVGGGSGGKKASERPSPVAWGASDALANLRAVLVAWVLFCAEEDVRNSSPTAGLPADNLPALSRWLLWRVDGLALHDIGPDAVEEITSAVAHCHRLIDRPADRQYLGPCGEQECSGHMYVRSGGESATCNECGTPVSADELRKHLLAELDDRLCTAAEIAHLSTYLGFQADRTQIRKRINHWAAKGQLAEAASFSDDATYRFGTVYTMLMEDENRRAQKSA